MELLGKLGIDGKLLLAQIVNFFILLYVLRRFAYKPVLRLLDERREKIEKGIKDADEAHKKLISAEESERKLLDEARKEAQAMVASAQEAARKVRDELVKAAQEESARLIETARKTIEDEKMRVMREIRDDVSNLIMTATEKVIEVKMNAENDREMTRKALEEMSKKI